MQDDSAQQRPVGANRALQPRLPVPRWLTSDIWRFMIAFTVAMLLAGPFAVDMADEGEVMGMDLVVLYYVIWAAAAFVSYALVTHLVFRRLNAAQLRAVARREARTNPVVRYLLTGGGAADWGGVVTFVSLGVVVLVLVRKELQSPLMLILSAGLVVSGWFMMLVAYAVDYLKHDVRNPGL